MGLILDSTVLVKVRLTTREKTRLKTLNINAANDSTYEGVQAAA